MNNEVSSIRIRAFVGRSFLEEDEALWNEIRRILESLGSIGLEFEDAKEAQLRPISEKVRQGIERNDFYIGILTRRLRIKEEGGEPNLLSWIPFFTGSQIPSRWTTSNWVVQETGFALGRGKKVLLLIEQGVDFPPTDLDADTEWVPFDRTTVPQCTTRLVSMICNLISAILPAATATVQVGPPEENVPPEKEHGEPSPGSDFRRVVDLLNQEEYQQADEEFERFIESKAETSLSRWIRYYYLRLKSARGHTASLDQLKTVVKTEVQNVNARIELARYYTEFKDHNQAAQILTEKVEEVPEEYRAGLLRSAAEELAKDNQQEKALKTIRDLMSQYTDPKELRLTYLTLAEVAKSQSDQELESAALERVLDFDHSDSSNRFRLAYLYSEMKKRHLSTYHYTLRLNQGHDAPSLNNLGISYENLKLPGKEIEALEKASEDSWTAKANICHAYVDRGFLAEAEKLATEITRSDCDEIARTRAVNALTRISTIRSTEKETEEKILSEAKSESIFRSAYAEAFVAPVRTPINGVFETSHGELTFKHQGNQLVGEGEFEVPTFGTLFGTMVGAPSTSVTVRTVKLEANIIGRAGRFKIVETERNKTDLIALPKSTTIHGLLIIAADGESFEVLEDHETKVEIYKARKIPL